MIAEQDSSLEDALHSPRRCCSSHWTGLVPIADTSVASSATKTWGHGQSLALSTVLKAPGKGRERLSWCPHSPWHSWFKVMPRTAEEFKAGDVLHATFVVA